MIQAIAAIIFSFYFIEMARMPQKLDLNFKPFNCIMCLPVWVTITLLILPKEVSYITLAIFGAGTFAPLFGFFMDYLRNKSS